jgi:hypothetical protein
MSDTPGHLEAEVELRPGERLTLPSALVDSVGAGRWLITVAPLGNPGPAVRAHDAFLAGYAPEDEGLYDADAGR